MDICGMERWIYGWMDGWVIVAFSLPPSLAKQSRTHTRVLTHCAHLSEREREREEGERATDLSIARSLRHEKRTANSCRQACSTAQQSRETTVDGWMVCAKKMCVRTYAVVDFAVLVCVKLFDQLGDVYRHGEVVLHYLDQLVCTTPHTHTHTHRELTNKQSVLSVCLSVCLPSAHRRRGGPTCRPRRPALPTHPLAHIHTATKAQKSHRLPPCLSCLVACAPVSCSSSTLLVVERCFSKAFRNSSNSAADSQTDLPSLYAPTH